MKTSPRTVRTIALFLAAFLACMTMLSWPSEPPCVEIASLGGLDDGQTVLVRGLLVDLRTNDGGSESLVLADREESATVWVFVGKAIGPPPSSYANVGDELRVVGNLAISRSGLSLYSDTDSIVLLAKSEEVLTVSTLSSHWELFLGDEVRVKGILVQTVAYEGLRLFDSDQELSLAVSPSCIWDGRLLGLSVVVSGRLVLDMSSMRLALQAHEINA